VVKTSVYLEEEQKAALDEVSKLTGKPLAELLRDGVDQVIHDHLRRRPAMQEAFNAPDMVGRTDELLEDLGA
jgi:hypothetical protein